MKVIIELIQIFSKQVIFQTSHKLVRVSTGISWTSIFVDGRWTPMKPLRVEYRKKNELLRFTLFLKKLPLLDFRNKHRL